VKVARAVMSNLIVVRAPARDRELANVADGLPLDDVTAQHPSRTIVLEHCPDDAAQAPFAAAVSIVTYGAASSRYGVEQIVVRSACPDGSLLSILRRLVRGDVPTSVWWTEDLSDGSLFDPLLTIGRQLVYDSRRWRDVNGGFAAVTPLVGSRRIDLADLNWRRLAPLRRALAHALGPLTDRRWRTTIEIAHRAGDEAMARLLAGWIDSARRDTPARILEASGDDAAMLTVSVGTTRATLRERTVEMQSADALPLVLALRDEPECDAVAAELRSLAPDAELLAALAALARRH
jgi:glucose-6-phosphate dehydrogenase assembly protein OpcA